MDFFFSLLVGVFSLPSGGGGAWIPKWTEFPPNTSLWDRLRLSGNADAQRVFRLVTDTSWGKRNLQNHRYYSLIITITFISWTVSAKPEGLWELVSPYYEQRCSHNYGGNFCREGLVIGCNRSATDCVIRKCSVYKYCFNL